MEPRAGYHVCGRPLEGVAGAVYEITTSLIPAMNRPEVMIATRSNGLSRIQERRGYSTTKNGRAARTGIGQQRSVTVIKVETELQLGGSDMRLGFQGGSNTTSTRTSFTSGSRASLLSTSAFSTFPIPQPGAVIDIFDVDLLAARLEIRNRASVDQAQVDDVNRNLRIVNGLQLLPDHVFRESSVRRGACCAGFGWPTPWRPHLWRRFATCSRDHRQPCSRFPETA